VAQRRQKARRKMEQLRKQGKKIQPVEIEGRKIARTFWGEAWCDHIESLGDFANRLPRGRTYVRNGSVCHLEIKKGRIAAMVSGSSLYKINITIDTLPKAKWNRVKHRCAGGIGSLLELLQGKLSASVMEVVTDPKGGLFPAGAEIHLDCNCPDWASLCKHLAAVLYGIGARLDEQPELLFLLRGVDHQELITAPVDQAVAGATGRGGRRRTVTQDDLAAIFGIDIDEAPKPEKAPRPLPAKTRRPKPTKKKTRKTSPSKARKKKATRTAAKKAPAKKSKKRATPKKATSKKATLKKTINVKKKPAKKKSARKNPPTKAARNTAKKSAAKKKTVKKKTEETSSQEEDH